MQQLAPDLDAKTSESIVRAAVNGNSREQPACQRPACPDLAPGWQQRLQRLPGHTTGLTQHCEAKSALYQLQGRLLHCLGPCQAAGDCKSRCICQHPATAGTAAKRVNCQIPNQPQSLRRASSRDWGCQAGTQCTATAPLNGLASRHAACCMVSVAIHRFIACPEGCTS